MQSVEDLEIDLLLEGVYRRFGQDFRGYRRESIRQRLHALMRRTGLKTVSLLQDRVMHDAGASEMLLRALSMQPAGLAIVLRQHAFVRHPERGKR